MKLCCPCVGYILNTICLTNQLLEGLRVEQQALEAALNYHDQNLRTFPKVKRTSLLFL